MRAASVCLAVALGASSATAGPPSPLEVSGAWSPATGGTGADVPLYLTIANRGEADDLLRVRCPDAAHFSEKRATDLGEGTPAAREVKAIPVPAGGSVTLAPGGYHVMLLQTTRRLGQGETFSCSLVFRNGGRHDVAVTVAASDAAPAPR